MCYAKARAEAPGVVEIVADGADAAVLNGTPDFVKSCRSPKPWTRTPSIALQMNGEPLPHFNGYPARLIVPGWTATYWMKHLVSIQAIAKPFDGFWMRGAYRIPTGMFPDRAALRIARKRDEHAHHRNGGEFPDRDAAEGTRVRVGESLNVTGIAWDGGYGNPLGGGFDRQWANLAGNHARQ